MYHDLFAQIGRFASRAVVTFFVVLAVHPMIPADARAGDLSVTQSSVAETALDAQAPAHLFLDIPFGISPYACDAILKERFDTSFTRTSENGDKYKASVDHPEKLGIFGNPYEAEFMFDHYELYQVQLFFPNAPLEAEEGGFFPIYSNLCGRFGEPTDASMVQFSPIDIIYYHFPQKDGLYQLDEALEWLNESDDPLAIFFHFSNVVIGLIKSPVQDAVFGVSMSYSKWNEDRTQDKRIDYARSVRKE